MLIKVNTVVYIDKDRGYIPCGPAIINTDKIFDITPNQDETAWFIEMGDERHRHIVTATEFARLQPLLIPAPVSDAFEQSAEKAQRQVPGEWQTTFDAYLARWYALKQSGADMAYTLPAQQSFNDAYATLLGHCATGYKAAPVSALPADVIAAYRDALNVDHATVKKTLFNLMAVLSHHIPETQVTTMPTEEMEDD